MLVGARLAALEMIKSGTIFANEMYWFSMQSAKAFNDLGMYDFIYYFLLIPF
jgi:5-methylthioadenosine/S-adenosylhomocysteine deaminase